jgi:hypothetical protein
MATASISADKTGYAVGERVTLRVAIINLVPGTPATSRQGVATVTAALTNPDETLTADSVPVTIVTPAKAGQTVVSQSVTFDGKPAVRQPDGTYTATA